jgi:hypothetical protein
MSNDRKRGAERVWTDEIAPRLAQSEFCVLVAFALSVMVAIWIIG